MGSSSRVWQFLVLMLALVLRAVGQSEMKRQVSSRLDPVEAKTTLTAEDAIVRINQRIFQYEKPWRSFLIEGDIIKPLWRNAVLSESKTWQKSPDGMVRIPYKISQQYDEETRSSIIRGFKDFEKFTCVQFLPHSDEDDFISIQPIHGCYSSVGRVGGMQLISLNHQCLKKGKGVVEHEIMHSLGFWHEHARSDRDKYIKIEWKNVWPGYEHNFLKQNTNNLMSKYDYGSILHYSRTAFSKNGQPTLRKLMDTDAVIGQRIRLSELDLLKVNRLYNCTTHLKDKANLLKHTEAFMHKEGRDPITNLDTQKHSLTLLYEDGSFRELGRAKEAGRLKPALDISPGKGRVHTSAHLVMASGGNGSIINWTMTATRRYPECFLVHKCSPTSWLTKLMPAVDSTSRTAVSKEPALEASGDQMELLGVAQVHKGKTETLFPTLTELPFVQSLTTNAVTTRSLLHKMSSALTMPSLTQRPTACPKAYVTCFTEEPVLPPQSQKTVGHIELLPTFPRALKISNQTQESMLFLADSFTAGRQGLRPLNWTDPPDTYTQTARVIHQSSPSVGFLPTVTNAIYPKRLSISHQRLKHSHQQRFPILPPVTQTQVTRLLKTVTPASEIKVPAVPGQPLIAGTGTTIAPEPLSTQIEEANNGQIRTATQTKAPTVASLTKGLAFLLRTGILASCNKACRSQASLVPTMPPPTESLLVSTLPGESLLVSTRTSTLPRPPEILLVSTPPVESLLVSTPPAEPQVTSTLSSTLPPPAEKLLVTNSLAEYLLVSTSPAEPLLVSIPPAEPQVASTLSSTLPPPAERLLVTNSLPESLLVSTPPAESLLVSTPTAAPQVASTLSSTLPPPAERLLVTNSLPESLLVSTPPAESLLVSTPTAAPQVASTLSSTLPPPAESLLVSISLAESVLVSTPPAEPPLASTLSSTLLSPAESLLVSTPPAESLLVSTPPAESLLVSTSPAEPPVASTLSSTLPPPAESLLASTPPAESLLVSTPPAESLLVSTPPAESLLVSTSPAEPPVASTLSSTLPPPAESLLVSISLAESLLVSTPPAESLLLSTPPAEPPVASILSSTLPPAESLLESSSLAESLLVSTPPAESLLVSTPPAESLLVSTPPAESLLLSTPPAESLLVSTPPAELPVASILSSTLPPAESLLESSSLAESLLASTPPAESLLASTPPAESLLASTPPAESLLVSTPPAESLLVSTPPAESLLVSTPPAESLLLSTPPAESLLVSTPPAELPVASILSSTLPPAESLLESSSLAESLLAPTPPAESLLVSTPPAEPLLASILSSTLPPPAESLLVSSSLAESLLVSTPPAEPSVASILSSTLPPAESLLESSSLAESLLVSTPPAESLVSTPPAESLLASTPPAESLLVSTPPAEPSVASILSSTLPPPAESLLVSSSLAESLLVSTPPAEPSVASILSSTLPPPAESLLVSSSLAESLLVSTPPAEPPLPSTFSTLPPPAESLLVFIPTAGTSAFDSRSLISPLTLTRLFNPVVSNPLYDVNMISPSHSVLSDELSVELLCDFEHGLCDWEQSTTDDFDWMLHRHQTLSRETGPKRDHTKGQCKGQGGRYLYLEASYPQQSGEQAALISPLLRGQKCLAFWYNMFGKHMGSLNVFLKYENSPHWHKLWSVSGNQGRKWLNAEIDIFTNGEMYRVIIEGVLGLNYRSDAAIDDVQIYRSSCAPGKKHPPSCNRGLKKRDKSLMG